MATIEPLGELIPGKTATVRQLQLNFLETFLFLTSITVTLVTSPLRLLINEDWPKDSRLLGNEQFDFIIVGGGTAGCVIANRLTEIADWKVLVIEAGGDPQLSSIIPGFAAFQYSSPWDWAYSSEDDGYSSQALLKHQIRHPRGKMLGGSSSINLMYYTHGVPDDYDRWESLGNKGWGYENVIRYFKKSENIIDQEITENDISQAYHGTGGPYNVARFNYSEKINNEILNIYSEGGYNTLIEFDGPEAFGAANTRGSVNKGRRESTAKAFLIPAARRGNLYLLKNARVLKVLIDKNKTAYGVIVKKLDGSILQFLAEKEVILSAGAVNTPQVLKLSGIGPKAELKSWGIPVIKNLPGVGENLQDHTIFPVYMFGDQNEPRVDLIGTLLTGLIQYILTERGFFATNLLPEPLLFFKTEPELTYPNMEALSMKSSVGSIIPAFATAVISDLPETPVLQILGLTQKYECFSYTLVFLHPKSRGRVVLRDGDPESDPVIWSGIMRDPEDIKEVVNGIKALQELRHTPYLKERNVFIPRLNIDTCKEFDEMDDEYWKCWAISTGATLYHLIGTAKMGPSDDPYAVVDDRLRVHGIRGLRVIDASIMPTQVTGHTCAPTVMIAEHACDLIKEDYGAYVEPLDETVPEEELAANFLA